MYGQDEKNALQQHVPVEAVAPENFGEEEAAENSKREIPDAAFDNENNANRAGEKAEYFENIHCRM